MELLQQALVERTAPRRSPALTIICCKRRKYLRSLFPADCSGFLVQIRQDDGSWASLCRRSNCMYSTSGGLSARLNQQRRQRASGKRFITARPYRLLGSTYLITDVTRKTWGSSNATRSVIPPPREEMALSPHGMLYILALGRKLQNIFRPQWNCARERSAQRFSRLPGQLQFVHSWSADIWCWCNPS